MKFEIINSRIGTYFGIPPKRGLDLYNFVNNSGSQDILELGFAHGKSTCYMAAALDEKKRGEIVTIDLLSAKKRSPNITELTKENGLDKYVKPIFAANSFIWELRRILQDRSVNNKCLPCFDFIFIDGGHSWETTGYAFYLSEKLLRPNGWILFDDIGFTYKNMIKKTRKIPIEDQGPKAYMQMTKEELNTKQVESVFELLVKQHPLIKKTKISEDGWWGWAQKG